MASNDKKCSWVTAGQIFHQAHGAWDPSIQISMGCSVSSLIESSSQSYQEVTEKLFHMYKPSLESYRAGTDSAHSRERSPAEYPSAGVTLVVVFIKSSEQCKTGLMCHHPRREWGGLTTKSYRTAFHWAMGWEIQITTFTLTDKTMHWENMILVLHSQGGVTITHKWHLGIVTQLWEVLVWYTAVIKKFNTGDYQQPKNKTLLSQNINEVKDFVCSFSIHDTSLEGNVKQKYAWRIAFYCMGLSLPCICTQ